MQKVYYLANLDCANCAAKIEAKFNAHPQVEKAVITFPTRQLLLTAKDPDAIVHILQDLAQTVESEVLILPEEPVHSHEHHEHHHHTHIELTPILAGAALFTVGLILSALSLPILPAVVFVAAYLLLGWQVIATAGKNLIKGHLFDENFLMTVATLGAFCIGEFPEAVGVMLFYRVGEYFEHKAVERSRKNIMSAVDLRPEVVTLTSGEVIPAGNAKAGDLLLVRPGDRIPLDGTVVSGESRIDTSPITGESVPVHAVPGSSLLSGCVNTDGLLTIQVEKTLQESMVTRILNSVESAAASKPKIDRFITRFARVYTPIVILLALCTAVIPILFDGRWHYWVYTALSFLVMSCPCALVLSVPLAFFSGIGAGSKQGILFKGGLSIEAMAQVKAVVMDKTGTLTKGDFSVQTADPALLALCAGCEQHSTHPIAKSIVATAKEQGLSLVQPDSVEEISGQGICATVDGSQVLIGNRLLMARYGIELPAIQDESQGAVVLVAKDGSYLGSIHVADTVKSDAKAAVSQLKKQGIFTAIFTGDRQAPAQAVANAVGIDTIHAQLLPQEKLERLQQLRREHGSIMFVGDGINDAPVLAGADVGAAMGSGADAAIEAADVVFMTSQVTAIPHALHIAARTRAIAWQNVVFALAIKLIVMILGLSGHASMWAAVFADSGVAMLCVLNAIRLLKNR